MNASFNIHPQLLADCEQLGNLELCSVLLMRDARFPWLILVPRVDGLRDLHDLPATYHEQDAGTVGLLWKKDVHREGQSVLVAVDDVRDDLRRCLASRSAGCQDHGEERQEK